MANITQITEALTNIPDSQFITVKKQDGENNYKSYVVKLDPTNLTVTKVEDWLSENDQ